MFSQQPPFSLPHHKQPSGDVNGIPRNRFVAAMAANGGAVTDCALFRYETCQWPKCGTKCASWLDFIVHLNNAHTGDFQSISECWQQVKTVHNLHEHWKDEESRLFSMLDHLQVVRPWANVYSTFLVGTYLEDRIRDFSSNLPQALPGNEGCIDLMPPQQIQRPMPILGGPPSFDAQSVQSIQQQDSSGYSSHASSPMSHHQPPMRSPMSLGSIMEGRPAPGYDRERLYHQLQQSQRRISSAEMRIFRNHCNGLQHDPASTVYSLGRSESLDMKKLYVPPGDNFNLGHQRGPVKSTILPTQPAAVPMASAEDNHLHSCFSNVRSAEQFADRSPAPNDKPPRKKRLSSSKVKLPAAISANGVAKTSLPKIKPDSPTKKRKAAAAANIPMVIDEVISQGHQQQGQKPLAMLHSAASMMSKGGKFDVNGQPGLHEFLTNKERKYVNRVMSVIQQHQQQGSSMEDDAESYAEDNLLIDVDDSGNDEEDNRPQLVAPANNDCFRKPSWKHSKK